MYVFSSLSGRASQAIGDSRGWLPSGVSALFTALRLSAIAQSDSGVWQRVIDAAAALIPVLFSSGLADEATFRSALQERIGQYLPSPFQTLCQLVKRQTT